MLAMMIKWAVVLSIALLLICLAGYLLLKADQVFFDQYFVKKVKLVIDRTLD